MQLSDILDESRTQLDVDAASKKRVLERLSELLAAAGDGIEGAPDAHAIFEGLLAREKLGSTGLGHGVGLPHARMGGVKRPIGALMRLATRIDFDAPDRAGVDLVFALLVPEESTNEHLQLLAQLASRFSDDHLRDALRGCDSAHQALELVTGDERRVMAAAGPSVATLYEAHERELGLRWLAAREHASRLLDADPANAEAPAFVGYMNLVRPHALQVLGTAECEHLASQGDAALADTLDRLLGLEPAAVIVADGVDCPPALLEATRAAGVPLLWAAAPAGRVVTDLQHHLCERLARRHSMHGVLLEVLGVGVMLTGKSGVGKSELALELISRGHRLVADDAPDLRRVAPDTVEGSCPAALRDFMEVRGLGIINVRALFGDSAVKQHRPLRLIIRLEPMRDDSISPEQRLQGIRRTRTILGVDIPEVTLPVAAGHNLAVLVECTVRNHLLLMKGYDAVRDFVQRQQNEMRDSSTPPPDAGKEPS